MDELLIPTESPATALKTHGWVGEPAMAWANACFDTMACARAAGLDEPWPGAAVERARERAQAGWGGGIARLRSLVEGCARPGQAVPLLRALWAQRLGEPEQSPRAQASRAGAAIRLPELSGAVEGLGEAGLFEVGFNKARIRSFIVAHEWGHLAQMRRGADRLTPETLQALGPTVSAGILALISEPGAKAQAVGEALTSIFIESYADCFAALSVGAGKPGAAARSALGVRLARQRRNRPSPTGEGLDPEHDSSCALLALRERLRESPDPDLSGEAAHALCERCAAQGVALSIARIMSQPQEHERPMQSALWSLGQRAELSGLPCPALSSSKFWDDAVAGGADGFATRLTGLILEARYLAEEPSRASAAPAPHQRFS